MNHISGAIKNVCTFGALGLSTIDVLKAEFLDVNWMDWLVEV